jgi:hypothetical protein
MWGEGEDVVADGVLQYLTRSASGHTWSCRSFTEERDGPSPVAPRPRGTGKKKGKEREREVKGVLAALLSGTHRSRTRLCTDLKRPEKEREKEGCIREFV